MPRGLSLVWWVRRTFMLLAALVSLPAGVAAQQPMRILMTNDDGIEEVEARLLPVADRTCCRPGGAREGLLTIACSSSRADWAGPSAP
jgi:hypothetical protein